ncbi:MAG TPA: aminotransferase class I/II-fold pyridoxal phosphate-dependent enzyme [Acidobacteriaceae bacterium]|jgi:aspartate aminotransferase
MPATAAMRLAKRVEAVGFSEIVNIRNRILELRALGQKIHPFHGGEPFFETPDRIKYALMRSTLENHTRYAPSSGMESLRVAIAEKLRERNHLAVSPQDVIVTAGGAHALFGAFQVVLDPGDDVLLFSPYWTPIRDMIIASQARAVLVPTESARHGGIVKTLERFVTPQTRAIYYNTPQNPTGFVFSRTEAEEVAGFAQERDLIVIADEAYEDLVYSGEHVSIASLPGMAQRTITAYTFSKTYAMTGWRIGYAVAEELFMNGLRKLVLYSVNGVSTMTQFAALEALKVPRSEIDARREEYRLRRDLLVKGLNEAGLECSIPEGAFYAFPKVAKIGSNSREVARELLETAHIATIPGAAFGPEGEGHVRFGYAISPQVIEEGLQSLKHFLMPQTL